MRSAHCPICGAACNVIYLNYEEWVCGCDQCVVGVPVHNYAVREAEKEAGHD